eukprot:Hpha_TRINITY_DN26228_c0_g1::TRINITY_DN26228_c0_g1_i1::g.184743::m.184743
MNTNVPSEAHVSLGRHRRGTTLPVRLSFAGPPAPPAVRRDDGDGQRKDSRAPGATHSEAAASDLNRRRSPASAPAPGCSFAAPTGAGGLREEEYRWCRSQCPRVSAPLPRSRLLRLHQVTTAPAPADSAASPRSTIAAPQCPHPVAFSPSTGSPCPPPARPPGTRSLEPCVDPCNRGWASAVHRSSRCCHGLPAGGVPARQSACRSAAGECASLGQARPSPAPSAAGCRAGFRASSLPPGEARFRLVPRPSFAARRGRPDRVAGATLRLPQDESPKIWPCLPPWTSPCAAPHFQTQAGLQRLAFYPAPLLTPEQSTHYGPPPREALQRRSGIHPRSSLSAASKARFDPGAAAGAPGTFAGSDEDDDSGPRLSAVSPATAAATP